MGVTRAVLSSPVVTMREPSGLNAAEYADVYQLSLVEEAVTANDCYLLSENASQIRAVPSWDAVTTRERPR